MNKKICTNDEGVHRTIDGHLVNKDGNMVYDFAKSAADYGFATEYTNYCSTVQQDEKVQNNSIYGFSLMILMIIIICTIIYYNR